MQRDFSSDIYHCQFSTQASGGVGLEGRVYVISQFILLFDRDLTAHLNSREAEAITMTDLTGRLRTRVRLLVDSFVAVYGHGSL